MHIHSLLQLLWLTCLTIATSRFEHQVEELPQPNQRIHLPLKKRQTNNGGGGGSYPVTGVQNAGTPPRLEIRELQKNADMFNIFLLGLARFHATPQKDPLSYYSTSSIHGRPFGIFDNVGPSPGTDQNGYCTHVSNLFLPWHRPYLALFEQLLFEHMVDCANEFPEGDDRDRYSQAASLVRLPYWDWAVKPESGDVLPDIVQQPRVQVSTPNGTQTIENPLFSYKFEDGSMEELSFDPFRSWDETKRYPTNQVASATSQNNLIGPLVEKQQENLANRVYNLLTFYSNFTQFSNEAWYGDQENIDSIEALHDLIHGITGKSGHMSFLDFAAFDPIFWLHHVNLDRFFAMWIVLYPDSSYVEPMAAASATFTIPKGSIQDADSPLEPFSRDTHGTKWTSTTVRDTTTFGYTYPETQTNNRADTISQINKLYGAGFQKSGGLGSTIHRRGDTTTNNTNEEQNVYAANPATATSADDDNDDDDATAEAHGFEIQGRQRRYSADLISNKHALVDGSYAIYLFVGDFDKENPRGWALERNLAGTHVAFSRMGNNETNGSGSGSDDGHSAVVTGGRVPLTNILREKVRRGELESLEEESVERYLRGNLHWRAAKFDDTPIPLEDISDLSIIVSMAEVTPTSHENELPTRENFKKLARITQGRKGGC